MAFRAPTHRPSQRPHLHLSAPPPQTPAGPSNEQTGTPQRKRPLDESEWILFSPSVATSSLRTPTERLSRATTASRFTELGGSHLGSLETVDGEVSSEDDSLSAADDVAADDLAPSEQIELEAPAEVEPSELDSLDDGLHAFHDEVEGRIIGDSGAGGVAGSYALPAHDGMGSFQFPTPNAAFPPQNSGQAEQLWAFERYTPRKRAQLQGSGPHHQHTMPHSPSHRRRRSSVQRKLELLEQDAQIDRDAEKRRRIESWRLEQSKALLEELERETRRQSRMNLSRRTSSAEHASLYAEEDGLNYGAGRPIARDGKSADPGVEEGFWARFTRRVIRDLMGIDDAMLSVILGEELPASVADELSTTPTPDHPTPSAALQSPHAMGLAHRHDGWEQRLINRLARELNALVARLEEEDNRPHGAFSTYARRAQRANAEHIPYLGASNEQNQPVATPTSSSLLPPASTEQDQSAITPTTNTDAHVSELFHPTLPLDPSSSNAPDVSLWGIEEEPLTSTARPTHSQPQPIPTRQNTNPKPDADVEYWERDLDARSLFRFLLRRFRSRPSSPDRAGDGDARTPRPSSPVQESTPIVLAEPGPRAAYIRRTHPLTHSKHAHSHSHSRIEKRGVADSSHNSFGNLGCASGPSVLGSALAKGKGKASLRRPGSSCASQSQSGRSVSLGSGRSARQRNFWDGTGSGVGSAWGEV